MSRCGRCDAEVATHKTKVVRMELEVFEEQPDRRIVTKFRTVKVKAPVCAPLDLALAQIRRDAAWDAAVAHAGIRRDEGVEEEQLEVETAKWGKPLRFEFHEPATAKLRVGDLSAEFDAWLDARAYEEVA